MTENKSNLFINKSTLENESLIDELYGKEFTESEYFKKLIELAYEYEILSELIEETEFTPSKIDLSILVIHWIINILKMSEIDDGNFLEFDNINNDLFELFDNQNIVMIREARKLFGDVVFDTSNFTPKGKFAHDITNPIMTACIPLEYVYLDQLKCDNGDSISYNRLGSVSSESDDLPNLMDKYIITNGNTGKEIATFYVYPYSHEVSLEIPEGFMFSELFSCDLLSRINRIINMEFPSGGCEFLRRFLTL
ncbi:MAG: hypothetical protein LBC39_02180 [Methanobrevibacter sp.]|jgi:hypothetical protein|nr:hypothetical protein [Candidatus Methanovirga aequatorialis]